MASFDGLPEELKAHIVSYLDTEPPSVHKSKQDPSLALTSAEARPLKHLCLTSHGWCRIVQPLLFEHIHLRLRACATICTNFRSEPTYAHDQALARFEKYLYGNDGDLRHLGRSYSRTRSAAANQWLNTIQTSLDRLLSFIKRYDLATGVKTLTVTTDETTTIPGHQRAGISNYHLHCYIGSAGFWYCLFNALSPLRLNIVAPPGTLACLTNLYARLDDEWTFPDMELQILTLEQRPGFFPKWWEPSSKRGPLYDVGLPISTIPYPRGSVLRIRRWTHVALNEGSFLRAYGSYEYFHRIPPSIVRAIRLGLDTTHLVSFDHQAMFPFSTHVPETCLPTLRAKVKRLHLKFAPGSDDKTLDDPKRVGKADLVDCWRETEQIYRRVVNVDPPSPLFLDHSRLQVFSSGDYEIASIREILDDAFAFYLSLGWEKVADGKWALSEAGLLRKKEARRRHREDLRALAEHEIYTDLDTESE